MAYIIDKITTHLLYIHFDASYAISEMREAMLRGNSDKIWEEMRREVGLLMRVDVSCEDVEFPTVQSGVLFDVAVDSQEVKLE